MTFKGYKQTDEHRAKTVAAKRRLYADPEQRRRQSERSGQRTHGQSGTGAHKTWMAMRRRVRAPMPADRQYYAGVDMDPRWESFEAFYSDMGDRPDGHTIDRIDGTRGYWPDNCRWATASEQRSNQVRSSRQTECHPGRKHIAHGLCDTCYKRRRKGR